MRTFLIATLLAGGLTGAATAQSARWSEKEANEWYAKQPWLVGSNYMPATAINQLEMWQADTFDPDRIETELNWAEDLGMNTMRVFLHDLLWKQDPGGVPADGSTGSWRLPTRHKIQPIFVLFDSVLGSVPGDQTISGRRSRAFTIPVGCRAPARRRCATRRQDRLRQYVQGVIGAFRYDRRVLAWDVWNEPDNTNDSTLQSLEPANKKRPGDGAAAEGVRVCARHGCRRSR